MSTAEEREAAWESIHQNAQAANRLVFPNIFGSENDYPESSTSAPAPAPTPTAPKPEDFGAVPVQGSSAPNPSDFGAVPLQSAERRGGLPTEAATGMNHGIAATLDQFLNAPVRVANLGIAAMGGEPLSDPNYLQRAHAAYTQAMGGDLSESPDAIERFTRKVGQFAGAGAVPLGPVGSITQAVKNVLFGAGAGVGAQAGGKVAELAGAGPAGKTLGEMAGSLAVPAAGLGAEAAAKSVLRGGATPAEIAANAATMRQAGIEPTVGQATGAIASKEIENVLGRVPLVGTPILKRAQEQIDTIGGDIADASRALSSIREKPAVGARIQRGLTDFVDTTGGKFVSLDNQLKALVPDIKGGMDNTLGTLEKLSKVSPELPEFSASLKDTNMRNWAQKLSSDTAGQAASEAPTGILGPGGEPITRSIPAKPFEGVSVPTMMDVRTDIGSQMNKQSLLGQKPDAQYSALYAAISKDIDAAVRGTPAEAALARRDNYWRSFRGRVDNFLDHIAENPDKTRAYMDTIGQANVGREQILSVRRSVGPEVWKSVASAKLAQMGGADIEGQQFNLQKFVKEYQRMSERPTGSNALSAADALFGGAGMGNLKQNLDKIAAASQKIIAGGPIYRNPALGQSGISAGVGAGIGAGLGISVFERLMQGQVGTAAAEAGAGATMAAGSRLLANAMVSPKVVDWLAKATTIPAERAPEYMKRLAPIINDVTNAQDRNKLKAFERDARKQLGGA
jgi:hypothetical protein